MAELRFSGFWEEEAKSCSAIVPTRGKTRLTGFALIIVQNLTDVQIYLSTSNVIYIFLFSFSPQQPSDSEDLFPNETSSAIDENEASDGF